MIECPVHAAINEKLMNPYGIIYDNIDKAEGKKGKSRKWNPSPETLEHVKETLYANKFDLHITSRALRIKIPSLRNYIYKMRADGMLPKPEKGKKKKKMMLADRREAPRSTCTQVSVGMKGA